MKPRNYTYIVCERESQLPLYKIHTDYDRSVIRYLIDEVRTIDEYSTEDLIEMFDREDIDWEEIDAYHDPIVEF